MDKKKLIKLMSDKEGLERRIRFYFDKKVLTKRGVDRNEIRGHIEKADHDIEFFQTQQKEFSDWQVVGCYYSVYHIALALILSRGFFSKNHDATLCILLKYFSDVFSDEEILVLNDIQLTNKDILFYVKSKEEREKASYSTQIVFKQQEVELLKERTLEFVNKCKELLRE